MPGVKGQRSGGHNAKTKAEHDRDGTSRKDRHTHDNPTPPPGRPEPPAPLQGAALEEWTRMLARLETTGALSTVDDAALFQYAQLFAETEAIAGRCEHNDRLIEKIEAVIPGLEGSDVVKAVDGLVKLQMLESKYITQIRQGRMAVRQYLVEFGMTPAARGRVKLPEKKADEKAKTPLEALRASRGLRAVK